MLGQPKALVARAESYLSGTLCVLLEFIKRQWRRLALSLPGCWRRVNVEPEQFPITDAQIEKLCDAIVASINKDAVRKFASHHSNNMPCDIHSITRGSYNIAICLDFRGKVPKKLLRIPLQPAVRDGWTKVQSEVATLEYIRNHTSIPVPRVRAYGNDAQVTSDLYAAQPYMLCDYISGHALTMNQIIDATPEQRIGFFSDLISIYAQLYKLRFPVAGSLMPNTNKDVGPRVGGLLTMARNELQLSTKNNLPDPQIQHSTKSYMQYQLTSLLESCRLPLIDYTLGDIRDRVFALHHVERKVYKIVRDLQPDDSDPFILTHPDLHYANIIVDEHLKIQGIIDWEFTGTVPQWLFTPPAWATGHDGRGRLRPPKKITGDFQRALEVSEHEELKKHWMSEESNSLFATAQILCHPTKLERLFYAFIFPTMASGSQDDSQDDSQDASQDAVVSRFFSDEKNTALAVEADRRLRISNRYTLYLKENGLYDDIEEENTRSTEAMAKMRQMLGI